MRFLIVCFFGFLANTNWASDFPTRDFNAVLEGCHIIFQYQGEAGCYREAIQAMNNKKTFPRYVKNVQQSNVL